MFAATGHPLSATSGDARRPPADLLTPSEIRGLLDRHGLAPRRSAGQNFVVDANTVRRIVRAADLRSTDIVVEFGPGLGSLTVALADVAQQVIAIDIDQGLVGALKEVLARRGRDVADRVVVVHADALRVDLAELLNAHGVATSSGGRTHRIRVVANLPYNVATPLVMHAVRSGVIDDLFVMVQREVGQRWVSPPGSRLRAAVSVKLELLVDAQIAMAVPRAVFHPVPNVDSVMVRMRRRHHDEQAPAADEGLPADDELFAFIDEAFAQRRKTVRNAWRRHHDRQTLERAAEQVGVDLDRRAEELAADQFVGMWQAIRTMAQQRGAGAPEDS